MHLLGILISLTGAFSQAISYLLSRHFVTVTGARSTRTLLVVAHVWMGLFSLMLFPIVWMRPLGTWWSAIWPVAGTAGCYFLGQAGFFWTVKQVPASRLSPLLGLKILFLGIFSTVLFGDYLTGGQWLAIVLASSAALCLTQIGGSLSLRAILGLAWTCTGYSLSDLFIPRAIHAFDPGGGFRAAVLAVALGYSGLGLIVLPWIWRLKLTDRNLWIRAFPFAVAWYLGMLFLFAAIGIIGVVLAIIIQSTRGLWSIFLGKLVADRDYAHLESRATGAQWLRQGGAAVLMCLAIAIDIVFRQGT